MARLYAFWYEQNGSNDLWSVRVGLMLRRTASFCKARPRPTSSTTASAGRIFSPPTCRPRDRPIRCPRPAFASASSRATICSFRRQCSAAIPAAATVQINRCRFRPGQCSVSAVALFSSPRRATFPIRTRTPAGFRAPIASAPGITLVARFRRSALRRYRPLAGKSAIDRHCDGAWRRWRRLWR